MAQSAPSLYRLLYRSRQTPEVAADLDFVVGQIIGSAIRRNRDVGLTGLLLVVKGHFIQALEGKDDAVRTTYARISMDPRHSDLHVISQGPAERRLFGEWNMCASSLAPSDKAILAVLDGKGDFNPKALSPANTQRLLTAVADIQRRTALAALVG
jgi:Sensors of blue-light using FAD